MVPESLITVNNLYKILKLNDINFAEVNKEIVQKLLTLSNNKNGNNQQQVSSANNGNNDNMEKDLIDLNVELQNPIQSATVQINDNYKKSNHQENNFSTKSISDLNSNTSNNHSKEFLSKKSSSQEKSNSNYFNDVTISETSGMEKDKKSGSDFLLQKELFDKEMNLLSKCKNNDGKIKNNLELADTENLNNHDYEKSFSILLINENQQQDCFSCFSL